VPSDRRSEILENPGFGKFFTDHMVTVTWTPDRDWHDARVHAYGPLSLDPPQPSCTTRRRSSRA
jgi:branched-chain amino acid aminotransferase